MFLPALQLLTGFGFLLMVSMRDPLRDTLEFHKFALGVLLGCGLLALAALPAFDYRRLSDWCYTPLFAALALFVTVPVIVPVVIAKLSAKLMPEVVPPDVTATLVAVPSR